MNDLNIFVVDDDPYYLNLFEQYLINLECTKINLFQSGTACLDALHQKPDIIFLDYNMDTLTGYEVLQKIKRFDPNIYVVMVSAQEEIKPAVDALKHGAFDYIQKGKGEQEKIEKVVHRITEIQLLLNKEAPKFIKRFFQFF